MKHLLSRLLIFLLSILSFLSCNYEVNPFDVEEVRFPKEGGVQIIHSRGYAHSIAHYDGDVYGKLGYSVDYRPGDAQIISSGTYEWLTIECLSYTEIKLTAEKNESGQQRKLKISAMVQDHGGRIPVIQE